MYFMIPALDAQKRAEATLGKPQVRLPKNIYEPTAQPLIGQIHNHNLKWIFNSFISDFYKALREAI